MCRMMPGRAAEYWALSRWAVVGTLPVPGLPLTLMPALRHASVMSLAAQVAGAATRLPLSSPWLPERAERGPHSRASPLFQYGTVLSLSNQAASPSTRPLIFLTPSRLSACANDSNDAVVRSNTARWYECVERLGSPRPRR